MNYPYANGLIKAIENKILDKNKLTKLLKTNTEDFYDTLLDLGYGEAGETVEELIASEMKQTRDLLDEITPEKKYTDLFFLSNDALNIKAYYKMKIFNLEHLDIFVETGNISKESLKLAVYNNDFSLIPSDYQKLFVKLQTIAETETNPRYLSSKIDNSIFDFIFSKLRFSTKKSLECYFETFIDFANILSFIRSQRLGWSVNGFQIMFLEHGKIAYKLFEEIYNRSHDIVLSALKDFYQEKVAIGLKKYYEKEDLNQLEKYFDQLIIYIMNSYKYDSFSVGPIIYYFLIKQAEAKNIRMMYASNSLDLSDLIDY